MEIRASSEVFERRIHLSGVAKRIDGKIHAIKGLQIEVLAEDSAIYPFCSLSPEEAQILIDTLWDCGVRPTAGAGSAGAMLATQAHLGDMRKLVNHLMDGALNNEGAL